MRPYDRTERRIDWSQELADHEKFLNQKMSFGPVNSAGKPSDEWRAFQRGATKVPLNRGHKLWRFISTNESSVKGNWWFELSTFRDIRARARAASKDLKLALREDLALTHAFSSSLDSVCEIVLKQLVYGWKGVTAEQFDSHLGVMLPGGAEQIYLPNLAWELSTASEYAELTYFGFSEDFLA